jgi:antibiotic biosynthesis monooxygenase (ABM) superfamily enzyme
VEVRVSRASAVVVQRIPAARADWFLEWQRGVTAAAEGFPGYRGTDVYPPAGPQRDEWVVIVHFADEESLRAWLDSPVRAEWIEKLRAECGGFELQALAGGFGPWFADRLRGADAAPPSWKMAFTVLLGLYPTVMLLTVFPGRYTHPLGFAFAMLASNALSVCLLQWVVMPVINVLLAPWLRANTARQRALSAGGVVLILVLLGGMALLFDLLKVGAP